MSKESCGRFLSTVVIDYIRRSRCGNMIHLHISQVITSKGIFKIRATKWMRKKYQ